MSFGFRRILSAMFSFETASMQNELLSSRTATIRKYSRRKVRSLARKVVETSFFFLWVAPFARKGIDLLLDAFEAAFDPSENVTLVLLVSGSSGAYQHNSLLPEIRAAATDPKQATGPADIRNGRRLGARESLPRRRRFRPPVSWGRLRHAARSRRWLAASQSSRPPKARRKIFATEANSYLVSATAELVLDQPPPLGPIAGDLYVVRA